MVKINITYEGNLHCRAVHGPSGDQILTDAPADHLGKGEGFSPTDLLATALGSCMLTVMGIAAQSRKIDMVGATVDVEKEMVNVPVRRVAGLIMVFKMPKGIDPGKRVFLEGATGSCPVSKSLSSEVRVSMRFEYPD